MIGFCALHGVVEPKSSTKLRSGNTLPDYASQDMLHAAMEYSTQQHRLCLVHSPQTPQPKCLFPVTLRTYTNRLLDTVRYFAQHIHADITKHQFTMSMLLC